MSNLEGRINEQSKAQMYKSENLEEVVRELSQRDALVENNMTYLIRRINELSKSQMSISNKLNEVENDVSERVGFTSCGRSIASESKKKFTSLKSSHGINVTSSDDEGRFSPKQAGFYLVLSNILSSSQDGYFIRKNGKEIARAWTHYSDSHVTQRYTAPLSAFMRLSLNDNITIEGTSVDFASCLTIVKL
ncbi:unnamed protein product [Mytilus coruscus]|uniref:C1q domain-containing protein n=1 Tax=Mytilus coruscus TaxID=42192 RepID=A0A6J8AD08_MYTCO|nr:unnamed protein product [Mytilus coruscus]